MTIEQSILSDWDIRFIDLAKFVSEWSKDPSTKVGAVVVARELGAIALGYNGFPAGVEDDQRLNKKRLKNDMIIHAEQNAMLIAGPQAKGASLYVWGKPICARCAVVIIQAGIERIIAISPETELNRRSKWAMSGRLAMRMFEEVERQVTIYDSSTYNITHRGNT
jgi:dCMP deaminase